MFSMFYFIKVKFKFVNREGQSFLYLYNYFNSKMSGKGRNVVGIKKYYLVMCV